MRCVSCDYEGKMSAAVEPHEVNVGDRVVKGEVPASKCPRCGEIYIEGRDLERFEFEVAEAIVKAGVVSGAMFRFLRHRLGMQSKDVAVLLDTTPETITRWERGQRDVDRAAWLALAMLFADRKDGRNRARPIVDAAAHPTPLPSVVKVA